MQHVAILRKPHVTRTPPRASRARAVRLSVSCRSFSFSLSSLVPILVRLFCGGVRSRGLRNDDDDDGRWIFLSLYIYISPSPFFRACTRARGFPHVAFLFPFFFLFLLLFLSFLSEAANARERIETPRRGRFSSAHESAIKRRARERAGREKMTRVESISEAREMLVDLFLSRSCARARGRKKRKFL